DEIEQNLTDESVEKFLNMLINIGHESPLEHVTFTFAVEGISRSCSHQIVRHRIASFSQQSQRYVKLDQFEYIVPPEIESIEEAKELFIDAMNKDQEAYDKLVDILFEKHYNNLIESGKNEKEAKRNAEKKAIEDARYVFPNACETKMVFTMNTRSLYNFFNHRCCE
ncbi:FAD-dependent thymidylate synthase, partial [Burkholderia pseudomallei]